MEQINYDQTPQDLYLKDGGMLKIRDITDDKPCYTVTYYTINQNPGVIRTTFTKEDLSKVINEFLKDLKTTVVQMIPVIAVKKSR